MPGNDSWGEIKQAQEDGRHELHLTGEEISRKLEEAKGEIPSSLFELKSLNYLEISDTCLTSISSDVSKLTNLINLALHRNKLIEIPESTNDLDKLKFLDLSFNNLTCLPASLCLPSVHTLNVSNNQLEKLPDFTGFTCLGIMFAEHNKLSSIPPGLFNLTSFSELIAGNNLITEVPSDVQNMQSLKNLDLSDNKLQYVTSDLAECKKLKNLDLRNNPLKDNRLKKMTVQCSTKAILEYLAKQNKDGGGGKKKGKGSKGKKEIKEDVEEEEEGKRKIFILSNKGDGRRVVSTNSVKEERPFICCCIVKKLKIDDPAVFKVFLSMQTKLHENECDMRTKATIATHSLSKLKFPLKYIAIPTSDIQLVALGKKTKSSAEKLIHSMKVERENLKQKKKRNVKTGLYKFLDLVEGKETLACLKDGDEEVISLPPITNSDHTKIDVEVSDVFIEITSPVSMAQCKYVMEELIKQMYQMELISVMDSMNGLVFEQMRVVDEKGDLRVLYPSKIDLDLKGIKVERIEISDDEKET